MLGSLVKEKIRPLVELNDRINVLTKEERSINSTRIVVVGDQSHGKSSLLEALSGVDLPRGEDIKTRVPLLMQLRNTSGEEHAVISIQGNEASAERIALADVAAKVDEFTAKVAGAEKMVIDNPIELRVYRHDQDDLTLVDLPGITRTSREGQSGSGKELEALILKMCRRYCEPQESVILNVVSAMVDYSTSASLQLSQELDPTGARTLLCVTKIDQHQEEGLVKKLSNAATHLRLRSGRVFAVRNRKQEENDKNISLPDARRHENEFFESRDEMRRGASQFGYGLGVGDLSARLVEIQLERIRETLPTTYQAIVEKMKQLRARVDEIGRPLGDELSCRLTAFKLVDGCVDGLIMERNGRLSGDTMRDDADDPVHSTAELSLWVKQIQDWRKRHKRGESVRSQTLELPGGMTMQLEVKPLGSTLEDKAVAEPDEGAPIGVWFVVSAADGASVVELVMDVELCHEDGTAIKSIRNHKVTFKPDETRGWKEWLPAAEAKKLTGNVELAVSAYVANVTWEDGEEPEDASVKLLCATLNDLDEDFKSDVDGIHRDRSFFSSAFANKLENEARSRRGAAGLPGAIAPEVPIGILSDLRKKLTPLVEKHVGAVSDAVLTKIEHVIDSCVDDQAHPKFHTLLRQSASALVVECGEAAKRDCARLLAYENAQIHTSNHYYMDIVQDLRREILADTDAEPIFAKRPYLKNLNFEALKKKGNHEQEIIDLQIKTFAYWKTLKKRLVDYVQMAARCNLSTELIDEKLKPALVTSTESVGNVCTLMAPDDALARERNDVATRLSALDEAHRLLMTAPSLGISLGELAHMAGAASAVVTAPTPAALPAVAKASATPITPTANGVSAKQAATAQASPVGLNLGAALDSAAAATGGSVFRFDSAAAVATSASGLGGVGGFGKGKGRGKGGFAL